MSYAWQSQASKSTMFSDTKSLFSMLIVVCVVVCMLNYFFLLGIMGFHGDLGFSLLASALSAGCRSAQTWGRDGEGGDFIRGPLTWTEITVRTPLIQLLLITSVKDRIKHCLCAVWCNVSSSV